MPDSILAFPTSPFFNHKVAMWLELQLLSSFKSSGSG